MTSPSTPNDRRVHTPVPWFSEFSAKSGVFTIRGRCYFDCVRPSDGTGVVADTDLTWTISDDVCFPAINPERRANAEFIVRAVNCHDDLVAALRAVSGLFDEHDACAADLHECSEPLAMVRAALSKASALTEASAANEGEGV